MNLKRREVLRYLPAVIAVIGLLGLQNAAYCQEDMSDFEIMNAVEDELLFDQAVDSNRIDVAVTEGVVTLTGETGNVLASDRAASLAMTVKGVKSVVNNIDVEPTVILSDNELQQDVETALLMDPATDSYEVNVMANDGVVTLEGTVDSWAEKNLCAKVAKGVTGVTGIVNNIDVDYKVERMDHEIATEIESKLRWNTLVDHALIDASVNDGNVTLTGTVGSLAEKNRAALECWVAGVESVDDTGLNVERWARDDDLRKKKYVNLADDDIRDAIEDALLYDPRVSSFNVKTSVDMRTVTLRGVVDNLKAKNAAEEDARNTVGVNFVKNRIKVRPVKEIKDETVESNVVSALARDPYVERFEIFVNVVDGMVYLTGTVDNYFEKSQAEDVASRVNGVIGVVNNIEVDYDRYPLTYDPYVYDYYPYNYHWYYYGPYYTVKSDYEIKDDINSQMFWSPFVDADDVNVTVEDGVAELSGTVDSWSEYWSARENAYEGGAVWVDNDLNVKQ